MLAPMINNGQFTCAHCSAGLKASAAWNRIAMAQRLLPFCFDIKSGSEHIRVELSEWENVVLHNDFEQAQENRKKPR